MMTRQIPSLKKVTLFQTVTIALGALILTTSCARTGGGAGSSSSCGPSSSISTTTSGALDGVRLHTSQTFGDGAVLFTLPSTASQIKVNAVSVGLARVGSPTGTVTVTIESDSAGQPSGSISKTATRSFNSTSSNADYIDTDPSFFELSFGSDLTIDPEVKYWIRLLRSGAASNTDYLIWAGQTALSQFSDVKQLNLTFSTWSTPTGTGDLMTKFTCDTSK